jgi:hypothetical protein
MRRSTTDRAERLDLPFPIKICQRSTAPMIASISQPIVSKMTIEIDDDNLSAEFEEHLAYLEGLLS